MQKLLVEGRDEIVAQGMHATTLQSAGGASTAHSLGCGSFAKHKALK
jgi:hypothetical protein